MPRPYEPNGARSARRPEGQRIRATLRPLGRGTARRAVTLTLALSQRERGPEVVPARERELVHQEVYLWH
jgi:hypothetical protein